MCEMCTQLDEMLHAVADGKRSFDGEVLTTMVDQLEMGITRLRTIVSNAPGFPVHELLGDVAAGMTALGVAMLELGRLVQHQGHIEKDRLVDIGLQFEKEREDRRSMIDHIINHHNADGGFDPAKLLLAELGELQAIHAAAHLPHINVPESHLADGR